MQDVSALSITVIAETAEEIERVKKAMNRLAKELDKQ
tara:strand:+ start:1979 stop:2089 length:111 start_codon:yes stop_codon:yes gene_type:complete